MFNRNWHKTNVLNIYGEKIIKKIHIDLTTRIKIACRQIEFCRDKNMRSFLMGRKIVFDHFFA